MKKWKMLAALAGGLFAVRSRASAQAWPNKPIKLIAPYPPGGQTDVVSRYFAEKLLGRAGPAGDRREQGRCQGMVGAELAKNAAARRLHLRLRQLVDDVHQPLCLQEAAL